MQSPQKKFASKGIILIIDDTLNNLKLLSTMLKEAGYQVRKAIDAKAALRVLEVTQPDLILLDIMMPEIDGYQLCQQLKASEETMQIPVIFLSALDDVQDKIKAFMAGGVDYITKPFQSQEVLVRVETHLTLRRLQQKITEQNQLLTAQNLQLMQEVKSRQKAQQELQQLNEALKNSNAELEQFAYTASHDLRSPLQVIVGFTDILRWKYKNELDAEADEYMKQIMDAAIRMKNLIQDLLDYSRAGNLVLEVELTDCNTVLNLVVANLQVEISSQNATIHYENLPTLFANRTQLMQVFQNLISNAIKFCHPEIPPRITISAKLQENQWLFAVKDNGIGIAEDDFQRVFQIFQRLQNSEDYPGTGIGMSICKKIIERHGGRIWLESQVGVGTTFYFTLSALNHNEPYE